MPVISHTAAQVLAAYGAVEVPKNQWSALLPTLFGYISNDGTPEICKTASLEALGYMCEALPAGSIDANVVNQILGAIIEGMRFDKGTDRIRLAAITALLNSLDFTGENFNKENERNAIMQYILQCIQSPDVKIRERAYECLAAIAELYYDKLPAYVEKLFEMSINTIRTDDPVVGMQAIEFWNTICDQEINIIEDLEDGEDVQLLNFTKQASATLVPLVLENMTKQQDDDDDGDNWDISMASAALLEGIARTIRDEILDKVLPFVTGNIENQSWRLKEASIMAFGMILDGPSEQRIQPIITQALPYLIRSMEDPKPLVRDTSAWTVGRICELHKNCISGELLPPMVTSLNKILNDPVPRVISQGCFAVHNLAEACQDESEASSNVLSHFMPQMVQSLLFITANLKLEPESIRSGAYEAINKMVENSALDMQHNVVALLNEALARLEHSFTLNIDANQRAGIQSSVCSLVGEIIKKLDKPTIAPYCNKIFELILKAFSVKAAIAHEDAFLVVGFLAEKLGEDFVHFLPAIRDSLLYGLKCTEETQLCTVAVGAIGDIARAVGKQLLPYCDDVMRCLLELLQSPKVDRSVKPHVISLFADLALAIEGEFERYAEVVLGILGQAGEVQINTDDEDMIEYINTLRNSILEAYTGIIQGLSVANKQHIVEPSLRRIVEFLQRSAEDENRSGEVLKNAVGLIGDLGQTYREKMMVVFNQPFVSKLIQEARQNGSDSQEIALWAHSVSFHLQIVSFPSSTVVLNVFVCSHYRSSFNSDPVPSKL